MLLGEEGRLVDAGLVKPSRAIWGGDWRGALKAKLKGNMRTSSAMVNDVW